MNASIVARSPHRGPVPAMDQLVTYWSKNWESTFPGLKDSLLGWGEPFCFRCGWLAPMPDDDGSWRSANGWLDRAHLQDRVSGGMDEPENIVPLCSICHREMPDFPESRDDAIAWVAGEGHASRPDWWQLCSDVRWGGDNHVTFPGRLVFINFFTKAARQVGQVSTIGRPSLLGGAA